MELTLSEKFLLQNCLRPLIRAVFNQKTETHTAQPGVYQVTVKLTVGEELDIKELGRKLGL